MQIQSGRTVPLIEHGSNKDPDMDPKNCLTTRRITGNIEWAMRLDQSTTTVATIEEPTNRRTVVRYCPNDVDLDPELSGLIRSGFVNRSGYGQIWKFGASRPGRIQNDLKGRIRVRNKLFRTHKTAPDAEKVLDCYLRRACKKYQASLSKNCKKGKASLKPFEF
jgi:hypothetical protein